jgi:hypothetical protein
MTGVYIFDFTSVGGEGEYDRKRYLGKKYEKVKEEEEEKKEEKKFKRGRGINIVFGQIYRPLAHETGP